MIKKTIRQNKSRTIPYNSSKMIIPMQGATLNIEPTVAALCIRTKDPNEGDWNKLICLMKYLNGTRALKLRLICDNLNCVIHWVDVEYLRLPMGLSGAPDMFQEKMSSLVDHLEYARVYLDDLLVLTNGSFDDHLSKLGKVLELLSQAGLNCNAEKCSLGAIEGEYLGYLLTRDGIRPVPAKIKNILALSPPKKTRQVRRLLGMIQYYRDL